MLTDFDTLLYFKRAAPFLSLFCLSNDHAYNHGGMYMLCNVYDD